MTGTSSIDDGLNLRASEAAVAALRGLGFNTTANSFIASSLTDHVVSAVQATRATRMASTDSNALIATAIANADKVIGQLTPAQQAAARAGIDPSNTAAVLAYTAQFAHQSAGGFGRAIAGESGERSGGGARSGERLTSSTYDGALNSSESSVFNSLSKQYGAVAANGALGFARDLGAPADLARKFIKLDQTSRDDLHHFVDEIRNDPNLTPEQKRQKVEAFRKAHPKLGKAGITTKDLIKTLDNKSNDHGAPRTDNQVKQKRTETGVEKQLDDRRGQAVTAAQRTPNESMQDRLAAFRAKAQKPEAKSEPPIEGQRTKVSSAPTAPSKTPAPS